MSLCAYTLLLEYVFLFALAVKCYANSLVKPSHPLTYPDLYRKVFWPLYSSVRSTIQDCRAACIRCWVRNHLKSGVIVLAPRKKLYSWVKNIWSRGMWAGGRLHSGLTHPPFDSSTAMFVYRLLYHSVNCVITVSIYYVWGQMDTYITCHVENRQTCIF